MSLSLHTIKSNKGARRARKRIGRGNAAGQGTYCGKGLKGQKCRSGVSGLKRIGMKQVLLRTPKKRGFRSLQPKKEVVNLSAINKHFKDGDKIDTGALFEKKLISTKKNGVKILGLGELKIKNLEFKGVSVSESAVEQIKKMKGLVKK